MRMLQDMANHKRDTLVIDTADVQAWCAKVMDTQGDQHAPYAQSLMGGVMYNTLHYEEGFYDEMIKLLPEQDHGVSRDPQILRRYALSKQFQLNHRLEQERMAVEEDPKRNGSQYNVPNKLMFPYDVRFKENRTGDNALAWPLREIKSHAIGKLVLLDVLAPVGRKIHLDSNAVEDSTPTS